MTVTALRTASAARLRARSAAPIYRSPLVGAFVAMIVMVIVGPYMTFHAQPFSGEGNPTRQAGYVIILGIVLFAMRPHLKPDRLLPLPWTLVLLLVWCWISLSWALDASIGVRRLALTTLFIWTMFLIVRQLEFATTIMWLRRTMIVALIANYLMVIVFPQAGIHQAADEIDQSVAGAWRGFMTQKNFAGALCAFTLIAFLFDGRQLNQMLRWAVIAAAAFFLYHSESKTSGGFLAAAILAGLLFSRYNPNYRSLLIPAVTIVVPMLIVLAQVYWDQIIAPLNDPSAFTGRTQIWKALLDFARDHPVFGAGYGSFWNIGQGTGPIFSYAKGWIVSYAAQGHDGYLDLVVSIGVPGLILAVAALLLVPIARLLASRTIDRGQGALLMAMLIFCAGNNLTESSLLERDVIVEAFLIFAIASVTTLSARSETARAGSAGG